MAINPQALAKLNVIKTELEYQECKLSHFKSLYNNYWDLEMNQALEYLYASHRKITKKINRIKEENK